MALKTSFVVATFCVAAVFSIGIKPKDCFRPKEAYSCGGGCQATCTNYNETCPIRNIFCNDWCYCVEGYARDQTGSCVPIEVCQDRLNGICGESEEVREDFYLHNDCHEQLLEPEVEPGNVRGCFCIAGYKRSPCGECIPEDQCPPKPPAKYPQLKVVNNFLHPVASISIPALKFSLS